MRNILLCHRPNGAFGYISDGWFNCLKQCGFNVQRWDSDINTWNSFKPDLYIGCSAHRQPVPKDNNCILAMHVNPYGPVDCGGINEPPESIKYVSDVLKPHVVFGYGFDDDNVYWKYWNQKAGIIWVPMPTGLDSTIFYQNKSLHDRKIDLIYVGGKWQYKSITMDEYLLPSIERIKHRNKICKIYGWGDWNSNICLGVISDSDINNEFNNSKVGPCMSEKHTHKWGFDLPERVWKLAACGVLPIHDPVPTLRHVLKNLPMAKNPTEYSEMIEYYIDNDNERISLVEDIKKEVIQNHSYHSRLSRLFMSIGWVKESNILLNGISHI